MKGALPTQDELENVYPTWPRFVGSPNDVLVEFDFAGAGLYFLSTGDVVRWGVKSATAIQSGLATWFIWTGQDSYDPPDRGFATGAPNGFRNAAMAGTISEQFGSPIGDMQLVDVNIVAGERYECGAVNFTVPRTYTW